MYYRKYLGHCLFKHYHEGFLLDDILKNDSKLRYWCYAEHMTPSGLIVVYVFLVFYSNPESNDIFNILKSQYFTVNLLKDSKPSRLYRKYIKETGFHFNLGKTKPIPGTFNERKGGLKECRVYVLPR